MIDRIFLRLSEGWALGFDKLQWMVMRRRKRREERYWQPVSFIASEKRILERVLREMGAEVTPKGRAGIDSLRSTFREWLAQQNQAME